MIDDDDMVDKIDGTTLAEIKIITDIVIIEWFLNRCETTEIYINKFSDNVTCRKNIKLLKILIKII